MKKRNKHKTKKFIRSAFKQQYPPFYLALSLAIFSVLVISLLSPVMADDWQHAFAVLDVSQPVSQAFADFNQAVTPMVEFTSDVSKFYELAADEMSTLLVADGYFDSGFVVVDGVGDFYQLASLEMEKFLDFSDLIPIQYQPQVAGASR
jgi:hypothetical protein